MCLTAPQVAHRLKSVRPAGFWRIPPSRRTVFALLVGKNLAGNGTHCTPRVSVVWPKQVPASREQHNRLALLLPDGQPRKGKLRVSEFESCKNEPQWLYSNWRILLAEIYIDWKEMVYFSERWGVFQRHRQKTEVCWEWEGLHYAVLLFC